MSGWKDTGRRILKSRDYVTPENRLHELKLSDGTSVGKVSYGAYNAVKYNNLDKYTPKNDDEKKVLDNFKTQVRINSNPVFKRYNIDPENFGMNELAKWAGEHNQVMRLDGSMKFFFTPKREGGVFGIGGKKLSTEQEDADLKVLQQLAENNARRVVSQNDYGKAMAAISGFADGATFGLARVLNDSGTKKKYSNAGLDINQYVSPSDMWKKTTDAHTVSEAIGSVAGSIPAFYATGEIAAAGLSKIPKYVSLAEKAAKGVTGAKNIKNMIDTAAVVGGTTLISSSARQNWGDDPWYKSVGNVILDTTVSSAGAYLGSVFSTKLGKNLAALLKNKTRLSNAAIAGLTSTGGALTFAGTVTGIQEMRNAITCAVNKTRYAPDFAAMAANMVTLAVYSGLKGYTQAKKSVGANAPRSEKPFKYFTEEDMKSPDALKKKMRSYAKEYHPDRFQSKGSDAVAEANKIFSEINAEYDRAKQKCASNIVSDIEREQSIKKTQQKKNGNEASVEVSKKVNEAIDLLNDIYESDKSFTISAVNNTQKAENAAPKVQSDELSELMGIGDTWSYATANSSAEIKHLEDALVANGADDTEIKDIIASSVKLEEKLDGKDSKLREAFNSVSGIISSAVSEIKKDAGPTSGYWNLFGSAVKALNTGEIKNNSNLAETISGAYSKALKNSDIEKYNSLFIDSNGVDISSELPRAVTENVIPPYVKNAADFKIASLRVKNIAENAENKLQSIYEGLNINKADDISSPEAESMTVSEPKIETVPKKSAKKVIRAKKADWASHDVYWYAPESKTVVAYSTKAASDLIEAMADDNPTMTISEMYGAVNYDAEAKKVLKAYIDSGFGGEAAGKHFSRAAGADSSVIKEPESVTETPKIAEKTEDLPQVNPQLYKRLATINDKSSADNNISQDNTIVNSDTPDNMESITHTDEKAEEKQYTHLYDEDKVSKEYLGSVNPEIEEAVNNIRKGDTDKVPKVIKVTELDGKTVKAISDFVGYDISGYSCKIERDRLLHIENRHGINGKHDHSLSDPKDIARMGYVINNSDSIDWVVDNKGNKVLDKQYKDKNNKPSPVIMLSSKIDGTYCVSQAVPDSKNKTIWIASARIQKADVGSQVPHGRKTTPWLQTPETPLDSSSASDNNISQDNNIVNSNIYNEAENDTKTLTDKCELTATKHTATGDDIWVVSLKDRLSSEEYKELKEKVKSVGGYYSKYTKTLDGKSIPGFVFKSEPTAKELKVFNDFFASEEKSMPSESKPQESKNINEQPLNNQPENDIIEEKNEKEIDENVHNGLLERESGNNSAVRQPERISEAEEKRETERADRESGENVAPENGEHVQASERETSSEGQLGGGDGDRGIRKSDSSHGDSRPGTRGNDNVDVTNEAGERSGKAKDFTITKTAAESLDTSAPSMADNLQAIETLYDIEQSGKAPTKAQQSILAKYKGWGGLSSAFFGASREKLRGVMSESELKAAQSTVNDAYFTPTGIVDSMYKALEHLGFEGGNILEPSMGVGNFFGRMPKSIKENSSLFGVEIDSISGRIAKQLYPSARIEISPFQDAAYKDGAFDLIVGNVPFGEVKYSYKGKKYLIHDYFFVKAMDKLADGGILAFLTTKGTLDKLDSTTRTKLSGEGKLIAAYRLPSDVFSKSAGANVVTDLIIMQKSSEANGEHFVNLGALSVGEKEFAVNEYFANHPENILGELTVKRDWRSGKDNLDVVSTGNTAEQLLKAVKSLKKNLLNGVQTVGSTDVTESKAPLQTFALTDNGEVEYTEASTGDVKRLKGKTAKTAKDYMDLKKAYGELVEATLSGDGAKLIEEKRKALNSAYDGFVKKHGTIEKNKKALSADNDFYKVSGLEVYDTKTKKTVKSEMFTKDTLGKRKPKHADTALDALSISIGETGGVDINRIAGLTGISEKEAVKQLDDRIIYTPDGVYELNEVYLSGNVREKYEAVKGKKGFEKNEQMLKAVIPQDIPAKNITPQFGAPWIKPQYVSDFMKELFHLYGAPDVNYDPITGTWSVSGNTWGDNTLLTSKYGTKYIDGMKLAEKALNMRRIVVTDRDGKTIVSETRAAQQKAEDIKAAFEEWCFKDSDRRNTLVDTFNRKFNSNRNMDFSELAKYLTFDGLSDTFKLRDYQKRAVARAVFNGNTLLAHGVGTGKTAEMISIAMELKRMGIAKKNMMVVPNHKVADFRNDILKMYPSAKVAYLEKGANSAQRQRFYALVASNDFDIAIIPHSSFGMLDVSADTKKAFINNQIAELEEVLTAAQAEKGKIDGRFISSLENQKKRLQERLKFVTESAKDSGNTFEELGVDSLFVDEAHNFKNLPFSSKLSRVAGVSVHQSSNKTRASRAENMFMITDYLNKNGGRITFGTATPITNSMSEIYNMLRFLRPDILSDAGLRSFDAWASMFGSIVNQAEVDPSGRNMRMKERFSKFKNVSQMVEQFRRMADILKTGDVIRELPEVQREDVYSETNPIQEEFLDIIDGLIDDIRTNGQRADHNMLEVTTAGQMAALDLRLVASYFDGKYTVDDLNLPDNRSSKVAQKVYDEYVASKDGKGTQFIFCDKGVYDNPNAKYGFHVYGDLINKLVALGIPREEIAVAQEFDNKADLSAKMNTGEIRVLIGSTAVMGEGMNAQNKAVALHHMTVPDRPSDIEQREGRIIRYGNENKKVRIYRYIQLKSYDSYQWQMQERKASFINQALSGGTVDELEEMSDFQLSAREAKAIASGNPLLLEKIEAEDKLNGLKSLRSKFNTDKLEMRDRLAKLPGMIANKEKIIADTAEDVKTLKANAANEFEITLGKTKYTERTKAAEALKKGLVNAPRNGTRIKIGSFKGLDLYYSSAFDTGTHFILKGTGEYSTLSGDSASGNITRIMNLADKIGENIEADKMIAEGYKAETETLRKEITAEFPKAKELEALQSKLNDIDTKLGINVSTVDMSDVVVDDEAAKNDTNYSITESEDSEYGQTGSDLLSGDGRRASYESAGKQTSSISKFKQEIEGKPKTEREAFAKELSAKGFTEEKIDGTHKYELIKPEAYNDDMRAMAAKAKEDGTELGFFRGAAVRKFDGQKNFLIDGIRVSDDKILLRYDGVQSPQKLLKHENVHNAWDSAEMQQMKDSILESLSEGEKKEILAEGRYKEYMMLYGGDEEAVWEEFVADVMAGMNDHTAEHIGEVAEYWYGDKTIDRYNPAEYNNITDTGGKNAVILDDIGFVNENTLFESGDSSGYGEENRSGKLGRDDYTRQNQGPASLVEMGYLQQDKRDTPNTRRIHRSGVSAEVVTSSGLTAEQTQLRAQNNIEGYDTYSLTTSKREYALVSRAIMAKNAGLKDSELKPGDYVYAADEFYVYENHSIGDFTISKRLDPATDGERINTLRGLIENGIYTNADRERLDRLVYDVRSGKRGNYRNDVRLENGRTAVGDDRVLGKQQGSDSVGHSSGIRADNKIAERANVSATEQKPVNNSSDIQYSLTTSKREYALVSRAIMAKNAGLKDSELKPVDYVYAADEFYVYENRSIGDFTLNHKIDIEGNGELINKIRSEIEDGTYRGTEDPYTLAKEYKSRRGSYNRNNGRAERAGTHGNDAGLSVGQQGSDTVGHSSGIRADNKTAELTQAEWRDFYNSLGELKRGMWFPSTLDGDYIFETADKLIFTDGDYTNPKISGVIQFKGLDMNEIEFGKEVIRGVAERSESREEYCEAARAVLGKGNVTSTSIGTDKTNRGSENNRGERKNSSEINGRTEQKRNIKYSLNTAESDTGELTPERRKEIFDQYNKDRAGVIKPTQRQLWGERAAWVANNTTRVFPSIPERGEAGTFFAEFRKNMIQWRQLPSTASLMVQDKLNQMTEGLTPKEFKTFSELVYFLDLQEEAQIQRDKGYTEILLPNEITPREVDSVVEELNGEATEKVRKALDKRREIWDDLKNQYVELNRYIGFDTDGKFKRKNYYHHQVIDYMNGSGKSNTGGELGIKAGRGWLKERQGSTKAINTDFLAVENKAMLQMQYDVYIAETLGNIKKQYDIKPRLENDAFKHNKKALNDIILKEATGKDGKVALDKNGEPDSETFRRQKWYNRRIMYGFRGLFDLAGRGDLPSYDGEYTAVVNALKNRSLNVSGLYSYVGALASTELPSDATDAQEQAVMNARTVLKYTSQKKSWIKEVLGSDYQTWETLAKSMSDTHSIHQPRRGNYFYTKTVINEDAFNKAYNDMILALASGDVKMGDTDINKLFEQYSDTVRLTGAAYEQWVLPNEIVKTMAEIANPKQVGPALKVVREIVSAWKGWATSVNPLRTVKFGIRNFVGDLDAVIAGNPKILRYSKQATQDIYQAMKNKKYSPDFREWTKRGGFTSMIFANEMDTEMQKKLFSRLMEKQGKNAAEILASSFQKYYDGVENAHNFREAILRYSAYLYFKNDILNNGGKVKDYVASNRYIVNGLITVEDKAYQLSKDLLGAYDEVGKFGQSLRRYWVPFYSFTETNLKRYYRLFENTIASDDKIPKKAGKLLLKALMVNMLGLLMAAWNRLVMKDEDDKLPPTARNVPHITLGKIGDKTYAFRQLGSFSELLEWFGLEDYKWTKDDIMAPVDKAWGMITPFAKMLVELVSGLDFYPSLSNPRAIRDKWNHFFNSLGVSELYDKVTGKPTRGVGDIVESAFVYSYDEKESAYYEILDIKREYQGKTDGDIHKPKGEEKKRSDALYYMKKAVRFKDKKAALKYLDEYFEHGGTAKGIKTSISTLNPMYGFLSGKDSAEKINAFTSSLSEAEKEKLKIAQDFYDEDLALPENVLKLLGKKGITEEEATNVLKNYIDGKCR